jgi:hypothetical protein
MPADAMRTSSARDGRDDRNHVSIGKRRIEPNELLVASPAHRSEAPFERRDQLLEMLGKLAQSLDTPRQSQ